MNLCPCSVWNTGPSLQDRDQAPGSQRRGVSLAAWTDSGISARLPHRKCGTELEEKNMIDLSSLLWQKYVGFPPNFVVIFRPPYLHVNLLMFAP